MFNFASKVFNTLGDLINVEEPSQPVSSQQPLQRRRSSADACTFGQQPKARFRGPTSLSDHNSFRGPTTTSLSRVTQPSVPIFRYPAASSNSNTIQQTSSSTVTSYQNPSSTCGGGWISSSANYGTSTGLNYSSPPSTSQYNSERYEEETFETFVPKYNEGCYNVNRNYDSPEQRSSFTSDKQVEEYGIFNESLDQQNEDRYSDYEDTSDKIYRSRKSVGDRGDMNEMRKINECKQPTGYSNVDSYSIPSWDDDPNCDSSLYENKQLQFRPDNAYDSLSRDEKNSSGSCKTNNRLINNSGKSAQHPVHGPSSNSRLIIADEYPGEQSLWKTEESNLYEMKDDKISPSPPSQDEDVKNSSRSESESSDEISFGEALATGLIPPNITPEMAARMNIELVNNSKAVIESFYGHSPGEVYTILEEEDEIYSPTGADGVTSLRKQRMASARVDKSNVLKELQNQQKILPNINQTDGKSKQKHNVAGVNSHEEHNQRYGLNDLKLPNQAVQDSHHMYGAGNPNYRIQNQLPIVPSQQLVNPQQDKQPFDPNSTYQHPYRSNCNRSPDSQNNQQDLQQQKFTRTDNKPQGYEANAILSTQQPYSNEYRPLQHVTIENRQQHVQNRTPTQQSLSQTYQQPSQEQLKQSAQQPAYTTPNEPVQRYDQTQPQAYCDNQPQTVYFNDSQLNQQNATILQRNFPIGNQFSEHQYQQQQTHRLQQPPPSQQQSMQHYSQPHNPQSYIPDPRQFIYLDKHLSTRTHFPNEQPPQSGQHLPHENRYAQMYSGEGLQNINATNQFPLQHQEEPQQQQQQHLPENWQNQSPHILYNSTLGPSYISNDRGHPQEYADPRFPQYPENKAITQAGKNDPQNLRGPTMCPQLIQKENVVRQIENQRNSPVEYHTPRNPDHVDFRVRRQQETIETRDNQQPTNRRQISLRKYNSEERYGSFQTEYEHNTRLKSQSYENVSPDENTSAQFTHQAHVRYDKSGQRSSSLETHDRIEQSAKSRSCSLERGRKICVEEQEKENRRKMSPRIENQQANQTRGRRNHLQRSTSLGQSSQYYGSGGVVERTRKFDILQDELKSDRKVEYRTLSTGQNERSQGIFVAHVAENYCPQHGRFSAPSTSSTSTRQTNRVSPKETDQQKQQKYHQHSSDKISLVMKTDHSQHRSGILSTAARKVERGRNSKISFSNPVSKLLKPNSKQAVQTLRQSRTDHLSKADGEHRKIHVCPVMQHNLARNVTFSQTTVPTVSPLLRDNLAVSPSARSHPNATVNRTRSLDRYSSSDTNLNTSSYYQQDTFSRPGSAPGLMYETVPQSSNSATLQLSLYEMHALKKEEKFWSDIYSALPADMKYLITNRNMGSNLRNKFSTAAGIDNYPSPTNAQAGSPVTSIENRLMNRSIISKASGRSGGICDATNTSLGERIGNRLRVLHEMKDQARLIHTKRKPGDVLSRRSASDGDYSFSSSTNFPLYWNLYHRPNSDSAIDLLERMEATVPPTRISGSAYNSSEYLMSTPNLRVIDRSQSYLTSPSTNVPPSPAPTQPIRLRDTALRGDVVESLQVNLPVVDSRSGFFSCLQNIESLTRQYQEDDFIRAEDDEIYSDSEIPESEYNRHDLYMNRRKHFGPPVRRRNSHL